MIGAVLCALVMWLVLAATLGVVVLVDQATPSSSPNHHPKGT